MVKGWVFLAYFCLWSKQHHSWERFLVVAFGSFLFNLLELVCEERF